MRRVVLAFRPFAPVWTACFVLLIVLTFGMGGGTGSGTLGIRILLLATVMASLVVHVIVEASRWLQRAY